MTTFLYAVPLARYDVGRIHIQTLQVISPRRIPSRSRFV